SFVAKEVMNEKKRRGVRFKDVMWSKPFNQQDASSPLIVGIYPQQNQSMMDYVIYQSIDEEDQIYCDGKVEVVNFTQTTNQLEISNIQEQCQQGIWTSE